jgi:hypothetical protein
MTVRVQRFEREEFIEHRFAYRAGEHVTFSAPTGDGKTKLSMDLAKKVATPTLPHIFFQMKPRDDTVDEGKKDGRLQTTATWPPSLWQQHIVRPAGWVVKPRITFDPDIDDARAYMVFRKVMLHAYRKGRRIVNADELFGISDLGLDRELKTLWTRGRSMGVGLWGGVQKPSHVPLWAYNCAEHLFLGNDPDDRNVKRFTEFGGIDPDIIWETLPTLADFEHLYLRRRGRVACIVGA